MFVCEDLLLALNEFVEIISGVIDRWNDELFVAKHPVEKQGKVDARRDLIGYLVEIAKLDVSPILIIVEYYLVTAAFK